MSVNQDPSMEEINAQIDTIIIRGMLITSERHGSYPRTIYTDDNLLELLNEQIMDMCFEKVDLYTMTLYSSNRGAICTCINIIEYGAKAYMCTDCASDAWNSICEICFMNSTNVKHSYVPAVNNLQCLCNCGNCEAYKNTPPCSKHGIPANSRTLPSIFVKRIRNVIRQLLRYLQLVCDDQPTQEIAKKIFK
ncbi:E3 ubiquitin-protein ligase UBR1 [Thelohanellus kitauei]|uniref:E3 ubiquitin-protein ligase n=1 Tax=Thelohanellus kitauei TaxID=669202 RepID=A0A0C2J2Q5_THEKT|nr:E3 ubiquitin-protein ligase UBR1 [Thelohanellus kitauei]